ncbi:MAG: FAD-binding oxidoreductase [Fuerstiella sp.]|nr:FAD-binding oxidoreductase [Fuerstiella sp.]
MKTADAIVIGAGINGSTTAFNLLRRGMKDVVLVEKSLIASGGTGDSAAIVRQHYSHEALVKLVKRSVEVFTNFDDIIGGDPDYHRTGWAFLVPKHAAEAFDRNISLQQSLGVNTRCLTADELHRIEPRIQIPDVGRIAWEEDSGYCEPKNSVVHAYVRRFVDMGGTLMDNTAVNGLTVQNGRVTSVQVGFESISAPIVVIAAGPWSVKIAAWAGVELPIQITREQEFILETGPCGGPPVMPFSDFSQAIYYRPHTGTRTLLGRGFPKDYESVADPDCYARHADRVFIDEVVQRFEKRFPMLTGALAVHGFSGLYDVTPDWNPILGRTDEVEGLILCCGFSGHGFKIGPAVGECLAEYITEGASSLIDISVFDIKRFAQGNPLTNAYGGNRA